MYFQRNRGCSAYCKNCVFSLEQWKIDERAYRIWGYGFNIHLNLNSYAIKSYPQYLLGKLLQSMTSELQWYTIPPYHQLLLEFYSTPFILKPPTPPVPFPFSGEDDLPTSQRKIDFHKLIAPPTHRSMPLSRH